MCVDTLSYVSSLNLLLLLFETATLNPITYTIECLITCGMCAVIANIAEFRMHSVAVQTLSKSTIAEQINSEPSVPSSSTRTSLRTDRVPASLASK